ncbi:MAG: hypothetical protein AMJ43_11230 [Coxiella sp. DG_40]|nr:MAG: hypothetical protein AMJ43_11230 [Coxiella sp. DG_40]
MKTTAKIMTVLFLSVLCSVGLTDELYVPGQYPTIQAAINAAVTGDTVLVADGTYKGPGNRNIDFLGKAITVRSQSSPENCIIDCQNHGCGFYFRSTEDRNSVIDGFTITNGYAPFGGGIYCLGSNPMISNCIIADAIYGSGIYCNNSSPTINNCTITGNSNRGGIFCDNGSPTINNCIITDNSAGSGGGICCIRSSPTITNCIISGNRARAITGKGGGIFSYSSSLTIANCVITNNTTSFFGGGIFLQKGSSLTINNCIITGNKAVYGGGICALDSNATIINCTINDNIAIRDPGGGIFCDSSACPITNCIIWNNVAPDGSQLYPSTNLTYSCIQNWTYGGEGNIDTDPCFVQPGYWADINDPNIIVEPNDPNAIWIEGDYHLLPTSPCIDTGDPNYIPSPNETDLDGNPRISGTRIDMGAYETNYIKAEMNFTPKIINCNSKGKWVKVHVVLTDEFLPEDVDVNEPAWAEPIDLESEYIKLLGAGKGHVKLEAAFNREDFCAQITEPGQLEVTIIGSLTTGQNFYATDSIKIIPQR